ncbi:MAG: hypothetical protein CHACPFDD_01547 [Phycisphaerae bacterium]|nr:hypothetical protein [Phycisphaerae bacterium]
MSGKLMVKSMACCCLASMAVADGGALQLLGNGKFMSPKSVARIAPNGQITSPWYNLGDGGVAQTVCQSLLCFDAFEPDGLVPGFPNECYASINCGLGSARWFFGTAYNNSFCANDMTMGCDDCDGTVSERIQYAWFWGPCPLQGGIAPCLIAVWTAEDWLDCAAPAYSGSTYSGVLYNFGSITCNTGYYFTDVTDLCDFGLFHQLPADGSGAYLIVLSNGTSGGFIVLSENGQPMLWGTKSVDFQGPKQYDDDNPKDAVHNFADSTLGGECYDYTFGVCPDPLGACITLYGAAGRVPCTESCSATCNPCDTNCDGSVNGFDVDPLVAQLTGSGSGCSPCAGDVNGDGSVNGFDVEPFVQGLTGGTTCTAGAPKCEIKTSLEIKDVAGTPTTQPACSAITGGQSAPFFMSAEFKNLCECCEYRQFVKGKFTVNGAAATHFLCDYDGNGTLDALSESAFLEDGAFDKDLDQDGTHDDFDSDGTIECVQYGHRNPGAGYEYADGLADTYKDGTGASDRAKGCVYEGGDAPGIGGLTGGTTYSFALDFKGQIVDHCNGDDVREEKTWSVSCSGTALPVRQPTQQAVILSRIGSYTTAVRVVSWDEPTLTVVVSIANARGKEPVPAGDLDVTIEGLERIGAQTGNLDETWLMGCTVHGSYEFTFPPEMIGQRLRVVVTFRGDSKVFEIDM